MTTRGLKGCRLLILEDDYNQAEDAREWLEEAGAQIVARVGNVRAALPFTAGNQIDLALLDINLGNETSFAVARTLREGGVPFVFVTGYERDVLPSDLADAPLLTKPLDDIEVLKVLSRVLQANGA
jgi:CheY-like chemotaxis protein